MTYSINTTKTIFHMYLVSPHIRNGDLFTDFRLSLSTMVLLTTIRSVDFIMKVSVLTYVLKDLPNYSQNCTVRSKLLKYLFSKTCEFLMIKSLWNRHNNTGDK